MRRTGLLVFVAAVIVGLQHYGQGGSPATRETSLSGQLERASRAVTLLDVWSQLVVPTIHVQHAHARALRVGDVGSATLLEGRSRRGLLQVERMLRLAPLSRLDRGKCHLSAEVRR